MQKRRNWNLIIGCAITIFMVALIVMGFFWTPYEPTAMDGAARSAAPSAAEADSGSLKAAAQRCFPEKSFVRGLFFSFLGVLYKRRRFRKSCEVISNDSRSVVNLSVRTVE